LQKRAEALTRVFTWRTDGSWIEKESRKYTFTDGVRGICYNTCPSTTDADDENKHFMGFKLQGGGACTMHYKCSILDKNDTVLRVVSDRQCCDFQKPPGATAKKGGRGIFFDLTEADKAGAVREDGNIKLRMVVHLYLPE